MKKLRLEIDLRSARVAEMAINDNWSIYENGSWVASDIWESNAYDTDDEDEEEDFDNLRTDIEEQLERAGIPEEDYQLTESVDF